MLALLGEVPQALLLLGLEQVDGPDVILDVLALGAGAADLVVVSGDARDLLEHAAPLVRGHRSEFRDVALLDDVVAFCAQACFGQDASHLGGRGRIVVDSVRGDGVALPTEPDRAGEADLVGVDHQPPATVELRGVGEDESGGHVLGWPATLAAVEYQLGHIGGPDRLGGLGSEHELDGIEGVRLARSVGPGYGRESLFEWDCDFACE